MALVKNQAAEYRVTSKSQLIQIDLACFFFFIYGWLPFHHWLPLYDVEPTPELLIYDNYTLLLKLPSCQYYSSPISHLPYLSVFSCIVRMHVILCN